MSILKMGTKMGSRPPQHTYIYFNFKLHVNCNENLIHFWPYGNNLRNANGLKQNMEMKIINIKVDNSFTYNKNKYECNADTIFFPLL